MGRRATAFVLLLGMLGALAPGCQSQPEWRRRAQVLLADSRFPQPPKKGPHCLTDALLASGLRAAVQRTEFGKVWDYGPLFGEGCPAEQLPACQTLIGPLRAERFPQIDLSVVAINPAGCPQAVAKATVVFDRRHPQGVLGTYEPRTLELQNIRFRKWDERRFNGGRFKLLGSGADAAPAVVAGTELPFDAPYPPGSLLSATDKGSAVDFMSPWPASVFKLMVATHFLTLLDKGQTADEQPLALQTPIPLPTRDLMELCPEEERALTLYQALETMLGWSGNCATAALVRFLHAHNEILQSPQLDVQGFPTAAPLHSGINKTLAALGLSTLQMNRTIARTGRWGNPADNYALTTASVANNHMTSWDTARLLWLFAELPERARPRWEVAPGRPVDLEFVSPRQKALLRELLKNSYSGSILVNNRVCVPESTAGFRPTPGIPALLSRKWLDKGRLRLPFADYPYKGVIDDIGPSAINPTYPPDLTPCQRRAEVMYLNKAGLTNVAASSVGIIRGRDDSHRFRRNYIMSFFSSLGSRFADAAAMQAAGPSHNAHHFTHLGTTQAIPELGATLDAWLALWLEE